MTRQFLKSKIHRATITQADLEYEGSLTIDPDLMETANILPYERVYVYNINNGLRFDTYAIPGRKGEHTIGLNGAAARMGQVGDRIIIVTFCQLSDAEQKEYHPRVVLMDEHNRVKKIVSAF